MPGATIFFLVLVGAVGALRLIEMRLSKRHQRALAAKGAPVLPLGGVRRSRSPSTRVPSARPGRF